MEQNFNIEELKWIDFNWNIFEGFTVALFAYTCHTNIFAVGLELKRPVMRRMNKIFFRAVGYEFIIYTTIAVTGYLSFLDKTTDIVIDRLPLPDSKYDVFMTFGKILMIFNLLTCIPLSINPCRRQIYLSIL